LRVSLKKSKKKEGRAELGAYLLDTLFADIDSLHLYAGTPTVIHGSHRCLSRRFPFAIFHRMEGNPIRVLAVLDNRQRPRRIQARVMRD
jgi:plasmid stabilization system protein ParE